VDKTLSGAVTTHFNLVIKDSPKITPENILNLMILRFQADVDSLIHSRAPKSIPESVSIYAKNRCSTGKS